MNVKICGLTRSADAEVAMKHGAWALGFIFYPKSPRYVEAGMVRDILKDLAAKGLKPQRTVGVFVNETEERIRAIVRESGIDIVQLHGDESPEFMGKIRDLRIWRALRLRETKQLAEIAAYEPFVEALLFDAAIPGSYGGTGQLADWELLDQVPRRKPMIVSGGLGPGNARDAWQRFGPLALDVASGVESAAGIKDHEKIKLLLGKGV
jgi:phosphoribosylanthranilate isomerase